MIAIMYLSSAGTEKVQVCCIQVASGDASEGNAKLCRNSLSLFEALDPALD
jgi:hypothetical protein